MSSATIDRAVGVADHSAVIGSLALAKPSQQQPGLAERLAPTGLSDATGPIDAAQAAPVSGRSRKASVKPLRFSSPEVPHPYGLVSARNAYRVRDHLRLVAVPTPLIEVATALRLTSGAVRNVLLVMAGHGLATAVPSLAPARGAAKRCYLWSVTGDMQGMIGAFGASPPESSAHGVCDTRQAYPSIFHFGQGMPIVLPDSAMSTRTPMAELEA